MKFLMALAFLFMQEISSAAVSANLSAVFDPQKITVKLKWQNNDGLINTFILQKSADNHSWSDLYKIERDAFNKNNMEKYIDPRPNRDKNYYRLKIIKERNNIEYTASIMIIIGQPVNSWLMYPVPVGPVLNLQYTGSAIITGVISVIVQNEHGKILGRLRTSSLNRIIQLPVTNLGRGIYDVRIMLMDKIIWTQRFIK